MARRRQITAPLILGIVVGLILYISLWPFRLLPDRPPLGDALGMLTWARASRADMFNNVLLYVPLGFALALLLERPLGRTAMLFAATAAGVALSVALEIVQASIATRVPSLTDLSLNTLGAAAGAIAGSAWNALRTRIEPSGAAAARSVAVAGWVAALWMLARLWPLLPDLSLRQVKQAVRPLWSPQLPPGELIAFLVGWLVAAQAVFHFARRQRAVDALLLVIVVVLIGRTVTAGNRLVPAEIAALAIMVPALVLMSRLPERSRCALLAASLAGWLAWLAIGPLAAAGEGALLDPPGWREFMARSAPPPVQLIGKAFNYLGLSWLLASSGLAPALAGITTAGFVLLLCLLQVDTPAPLFGWADLLLAVASALVVARWTPAHAPAVPRRGSRRD
jgi:VanZ family protein